MNYKPMSVADLLEWSHQETLVAEGIERLIPSLPEQVQEDMRAQAEAHRHRASWLDTQVRHWLDRHDPVDRD